MLDKKRYPYLLLLYLLGLALVSCEKDDSIDQPEEDPELEVESFIYRGMNEYYLYRKQVPVLEDGFSNPAEKQEYLRSFDSPEDLFDALTLPEDRFSFMTDDYNELGDSFDGISGSTGINYGIGWVSGPGNYVFGFLQYILPNTAAEEAGLRRGMVFTEIDGQRLTLNNIFDLITQESFTINVGHIIDGQIHLTGETVELEDRSYTENPVYIDKVFDIEGEKIAYLMYNSFIGDFDDELNTVFADFKAQGVQHLILDLRYNGGGSVESAVDLASMITGQYEGKIFMKEQWNEKYQTYFENHEPERIINRFNSEIRTGEMINSLNLQELYVLTTRQTASASELIINGLAPYIDVVQVGETTTGKFQGSITVYDAPNFDEENANENHTYALQPLVFTSANVEGKTDYGDGLLPDISYREKLENMGTLGDPSEPMLQIALDHLLGRKRPAPAALREPAAFKRIGVGEMIQPNYQNMYLEKDLPVID